MISAKRCCLCDHKYPEYTLHRFPCARDHGVFLKWLQVMPKHIQMVEHSVLRQKYKICESHFSTEDYFPVSGGKKRLKKQCIPSIGTGQKRTIHMPEALKKQRIDMNDGSTLSSDIPNEDDAQLLIDKNCHSTLLPEIPNGDITLSSTRLMSGIPTRTATALSLASNGPATNDENLDKSNVNVNENNHSSSSAELPSMQTHKTTTNAKCAILTAKLPKQIECSSKSETTGSTKTTKPVVNQQNVTNKKKSSTTTAILQQRRRGTYHRRPNYHCSRVKSTYVRRRKQITKITEQVKQYCYSKVNEPTRVLLQMQLNNQIKEERGRRYTLREKSMAALWLKLGPRPYNVLRRLWFALPSRRTIMRVLSDIAFEPGINERVMQSLGETVSSMDDNDKLCYITFNEMSLHEGLHYDIKRDIIVGFEDLGEGLRKTSFANYAMVVMVRGIRRSWKQAIAYYFTAGGMNRCEIQRMLKTVITNLHTIGLQVLATVCDASTSNISAINNLLQETRVAFIRKGEENRHFGFLVDDREVIPLFDPPHLLKAFRNNFFKKDLVFCLDDQWYDASWADIKELFELDCADAVTRMCNTLTKYHINPDEDGKMKVKNAAQIFSHRVSSFMRYLVRYNALENCQRAKGTAELLWFFDQLFDSVNGYKKSVEKDKFLYCAVNEESKHLEFWNKAIEVLSSIEFKVTGQKDKKPPCLIKWIHTMKGFKYLWEVLHNKYNFQFMIPRNINQDGLENFFCGIRNGGCRNVNPTSYQFIGSFKALLINSCASIKSPGSNCMEDKTEGVLASIESLIKKCDDDEEVAPIDETLMSYHFSIDDLNLKPDDEDWNLEDIELHNVENASNKEMLKYIIQKSTRYYLAGYMAKRAYECVRHCSNCKNDLFSNEGNEFSEWVFTLQRSEICKLKLPETTFYVLFCKMYDVAKVAVPQICCRSQVRACLKHIIRRSLEQQFLYSCTQHRLFEIVLNLFTRFFIRVWILNVNCIIWNKDVRQVDDKIKKLALNVLNKRKSCVKKVVQMKNQK
ncbi:hypothetical protein V9T40_002171 [Parthenolecanium corni]|uniref:THAP-type domain-containing protein n=1 Tax=Parthenolecanium corni TaxID=536013 RepID=A0AAN9TK96_9HEMI